jgi:hypothetical protein
MISRRGDLKQTMQGFRPSALRLLLALSALPLALVVSEAALAQSTKPISENGLVKALQIGGMSDQELIQNVRKRGVSFVLTPEIEAELRQAGASQQLLAVVRSSSRAAALPPRQNSTSDDTVSPPVQPPPVQRQAGVARPGVYTKQNGQWVELMPEMVNWKKAGAIRKFTVDLGKGEMVGVVPGRSSPNALHVPVSFLICTPEGVDVNRYLLVLLHEKKDEREMKVVASEARGIVPFSPRKVGERNYEVDFTQGAGDYGFLPPATNIAQGGMPLSSRMYTFRVQ